jgi:hypothetical protein
MGYLPTAGSVQGDPSGHKNPFGSLSFVVWPPEAVRVAVDSDASGKTGKSNVVGHLLGQCGCSPGPIRLWPFTPDHLATAPDQFGQRLVGARHPLALLSFAERSVEEFDVQGNGIHGNAPLASSARWGQDGQPGAA